MPDVPPAARQRMADLRHAFRGVELTRQDRRTLAVLSMTTVVPGLISLIERVRAVERFRP